MRKMMAMLLIMMLFISVLTPVMADSETNIGYRWYSHTLNIYECIEDFYYEFSIGTTDNAGYIPPSWPSGPMQWHSYLVNYHFPKEVIRDRSGLCSQMMGTPVEQLGITSQKGSNLRSQMTIIDNNTIIHTMHADTTIYVYFSKYDRDGRQWYYVVCDSGIEGYTVASRIQLVDYTLN